MCEGARKEKGEYCREDDQEGVDVRANREGRTGWKVRYEGKG